MYKVYQIFIMILKFDIFFQLGFSAQFLSLIVLKYHAGDDNTLSQSDLKNILILHLVLSVGACIVLPVLAWRGVSALPPSHSNIRVLIFLDPISFYRVCLFEIRMLSNLPVHVTLSPKTYIFFLSGIIAETRVQVFNGSFYLRRHWNTCLQHHQTQPSLCGPRAIHWSQQVLDLLL